jgi:hypothetical protein
VVILKVDLQCVIACPGERDPVIRGYTDRPAFWLALQPMEMKARDIHILGTRRDFQQSQDAYAFPDRIGADSARPSAAVKFLQPFMPEAGDHFYIVNFLVYSFKEI